MEKPLRRFHEIRTPLVFAPLKTTPRSSRHHLPLHQEPLAQPRSSPLFGFERRPPWERQAPAWRVRKKCRAESSTVDTPGAYAEAVHGKKGVERGSSPLRTLIYPFKAQEQPLRHAPPLPIGRPLRSGREAPLRFCSGRHSLNPLISEEKTTLPVVQRHQLQKIQTTTRRPSRHCSWGRWPRFPQLARERRRPSKYGPESAFTHPVPC